MWLGCEERSDGLARTCASETTTTTAARFACRCRFLVANIARRSTMRKAKIAPALAELLELIEGGGAEDNEVRKEVEALKAFLLQRRKAKKGEND